MRKILLALILILAFYLRIYKLDSPIADWHSWRQADTAAVARNFLKEGFSPLLPRYDDMSGVSEAGMPNPNRYRLVEFPIYPTLVYLGYLINGGVDERIARVISIFFSLGSLYFIYLITKRYYDWLTAQVAALLFAVLPFAVYYSRVILPEPSLVFFCLGMFYFVDIWIHKDRLILYLLAIFFTSAALLTKPFAIFYLLPLLLKFNWRQSRYWFFLLPSLLPFILWRGWIGQHPEGIPASNWLFDGDHLRFKPAFFRWIVGERLGRLILAPTGLFLFLIGILRANTSKHGLSLHLLAASLGLYLVVIATGNVRHDYYQYLIVPILVIFAARGFVLLIAGVKGFVPRIVTLPLALLFLILTPYLSWHQIKEYYKINNPVILEAGRVADQLLPKDAVIIAPYNGDTAFLYQTNRAGWPYVAFPTEELRDRFGARYFISVNYDSKTRWVERRFRTLIKTPNYIIANLTSVNPTHNLLTDPEPIR